MLSGFHLEIDGRVVGEFEVVELTVAPGAPAMQFNPKELWINKDVPAKSPTGTGEGSRTGERFSLPRSAGATRRGTVKLKRGRLLVSPLPPLPSDPDRPIILASVPAVYGRYVVIDAALASVGARGPTGNAAPGAVGSEEITLTREGIHRV